MRRKLHSPDACLPGFQSELSLHGRIAQLGDDISAAFFNREREPIRIFTEFYFLTRTVRDAHGSRHGFTQ